MEKLRVIIGIFIVIASLMIMGFENSKVFAEESLGYMMAEDVSAHLTFNFRDGVETYEFPVFKTTNFVANQGTAFRVHGVINVAPHLHKALDEAYKFRLESVGADYPYRFFDIDVEFTHALGKFDAHHLVYSDSGGEEILIPDDAKPRKTLHYKDCQVSNYLIDTVYNSYRSYGHAETGFAILEIIDFVCGGVQSDVTSQDDLTYKTEPDIIREFPKLQYNFAEDIQTLVTFEFDNGIEKIEFPIFHTISGFSENDDPRFRVEVVNLYPLLSSAIDNARDNRNLPLGTNTEFNVIAAFLQKTSDGDKFLRGIYYQDCHVIGSDITTYYDNEEPYAMVGGFAMNQSIDFDCAGMKPLNPGYDESMKTNQSNHGFLMASGINAIAEFRFHDNTIETIDFPRFEHQEIFTQSDPVFLLAGMVGDYPLLYQQVDIAAKINQNVGGLKIAHKPFDVDVYLMHDEKSIREFSYKNCIITNYIVDTPAVAGKEESFFFWFALENTFEFECSGYNPKNPSYDTMLKQEKSEQNNNKYWQNTQKWSDEFRYIPRDKSN